MRCYFLLLVLPALIAADVQTLAVPRLDRLSLAFGNVCDGPDIHADRLLDACETFAAVLKETGPQAVQRDFCSNLQKASRLTKLFQKDKPTGPTLLRDVLRFERDEMDIHEGNKLRDPSGAVGYLWMRRSLEFQAELYSGLISGKKAKDAALMAYTSCLRPYHGPVLRRFYTAFFRYKMPARNILLRRLGGRDDDDEGIAVLVDELKNLVRTWEPLLVKWKKDFQDLDMEDTRRV